MSHNEVEKTLKEIRERVRVQIRNQHHLPGSRPAPLSEGHPASRLESQLTAQPDSINATRLESLRANLSVIQRSWNKLPPLTSYRSGWISRLELWCKRLLKRASHWFIWEQVNFNSATHNSLEHISALLAAHQQMLVELYKQLERLTDTAAELGAEIEGLRAKVDTTAHQQSPPGSRAVPTAETLTDDRPKPINSEIDNLARRIEQLRALATRLK
jgi:hypothetical protein